jgi:hypothetical protein
VVAHGLERLELLEALRGRCPREAAVLYPGCFLHVTPSFFFQHVVYVDRQPLAAEFFADEEGVRAIVAARRRYREAPYLRFLALDYTLPLPLREASYDLVLALHAGGISRSCAGYLRPGGLLLSNDHGGDAADAAALGLELLERDGRHHLFRRPRRSA